MVWPRSVPVVSHELVVAILKETEDNVYKYEFK